MNPNAKLIAAIVAAAGTLAIAAYVGYSSLGGSRTVRSASGASQDSGQTRNQSGPSQRAPASGPGQSAELSGPPPAWVERDRERNSTSASYDFPSASDAVGVFDAGVEYLATKAEQAADMGPLGVVARRGLIDAWNTFVRPLIAGDREGFGDAIAHLGGVTEQPLEPDEGEDGEYPSPSDMLYDQLAMFFEGARVDLSASEIVGADADDPRRIPRTPRLAGMPGGANSRQPIMIPTMVSVERFEDDESGESQETRTMNIPLGAVFPEAALLVAEGAPTFEVWAPAKLAKSKGKGADIGPAAFFVFDTETRRWQPIALRVTLASEAAQGRLSEMMAGRRRRAD